MAFEVIVPEGVIATLSQQSAQPGRFGNVTEALDSFTRQQILMVGYLAVVFIARWHWDVLKTMCVGPRDVAGGGGLLSISACCPKPSSWNETWYQDYSDDGSVSEAAWQGSCWMNDHYPAKCIQDGGILEKWPWGERCVPSEA